jgi:hypothetical protein
MPDIRSERMVALVGKLLTVLIWLNWIFGAAFAAALVVSVVFTERIVGMANEGNIPPGDVAAIRIALLIGVVSVPFAHIALARLRAIVATVRAGDPFVAANARRLTAIAWSLLGIMICDLGFGLMASMIDTQIGWSFSLTGWLAILLLFVLARVFDHGTRMRDEIEGTV